MRLRSIAPRRRRAATIVEAALVISAVLMFLFGSVVLGAEALS